MRFLKTDGAPAAVGPYSQGLEAGGTVYVSGQLPSREGALLTDVAEATAAALDNVLAVVRAAGGDRESIVKCVVFLTDMGDFDAMNRAYSAFFRDHRPARSCIEVRRLPKNAVLEIEAVAVPG